MSTVDKTAPIRGYSSTGLANSYALRKTDLKLTFSSLEKGAANFITNKTLSDPVHAPKFQFGHFSDELSARNLLTATHNCLTRDRLPVDFGNFVLTERLGEGGFGITFKAIDMRDGVERVVKVPARLDERIFESIRQEGVKISVSGGADGQVVEFHERGDVNGIPYVSMHYVDGVDLEKVLALNPQMPLKRTLRILIGICESAAHYHALGVVHRDIKPENVLVSVDDSTVLIDPGLMSTKQESVGGAGTPLYSSPEQTRREKLSSRSEVFTIGIIMFRMLTGVHPFMGKNLAEIQDNILNKEPDYTLLPNLKMIDKQLLWITKRALKKSPNQRANSVERVKDQLQRILNKLP